MPALSATDRRLFLNSPADRQLFKQTDEHTTDALFSDEAARDESARHACADCELDPVPGSPLWYTGAGTILCFHLCLDRDKGFYHDVVNVSP